MRVFTIPIVALGVTVASLSVDDQPGETAMRVAFEASLATQVQNALDFIAESAGQDAVSKAREAGTDYFEVRTFRKLYCRPDEMTGHWCGFAVDIGLRAGSVQQVVVGRFIRHRGGLIFAQAT